MFYFLNFLKKKKKKKKKKKRREKKTNFDVLRENENRRRQFSFFFFFQKLSTFTKQISYLPIQVQPWKWFSSNLMKTNCGRDFSSSVYPLGNLNVTFEKTECSAVKKKKKKRKERKRKRETHSFHKKNFPVCEKEKKDSSIWTISETLDKTGDAADFFFFFFSLLWKQFSWRDHLHISKHVIRLNKITMGCHSKWHIVSIRKILSGSIFAMMPSEIML